VTTRLERLCRAIEDIDQAIGLISTAQQNLFLMDRDQRAVKPLIDAKAMLNRVAGKAHRALENGKLERLET